MSTYDVILRLARSVQKDEARIGVYSTGERIAVALVLDRPDMVKEVWGTMLEAVERLGPEWFAAALQVQRDWFADGRLGENDA
jgi:hypothetical protein